MHERWREKYTWSGSLDSNTSFVAEETADHILRSVALEIYINQCWCWYPQISLSSSLKFVFRTVRKIVCRRACMGLVQVFQPHHPNTPPRSCRIRRCRERVCEMDAWMFAKSGRLTCPVSWEFCPRWWFARRLGSLGQHGNRYLEDIYSVLLFWEWDDGRNWSQGGIRGFTEERCCELPDADEMTCRLLWLLIDGMQGKLEGWK